MEVLGHGSLVQRDRTKPRSRCRKWELSAMVDEDGKRRRKTRSFSGTYSQGQEALAAFVEELRGTPVTSDMPMSEWMQKWHELRVSSLALSEGSTRGDPQKMTAIGMHLKCSVGEVTPDMVRKMYKSLMDGDTPSGRPWKPKSVEGVHKAMTSMMNEAVRRSVIASNPMDDVKCPKVPRKRYTVITADEMDSIMESLDYSSGTQRAVALCIGCGLRRREAAELEWRDFGDAAEVVDAKTPSGYRSVPVPVQLRERIEPYREASGCVSGGVDPMALTRWWTRNRGKFGVDCTLHDLRRSYATRLADAGVHPRVMMELMGHSSINVCMEIYTHVSDSVRKKAVESAFRAGFVRVAESENETGQS